MPDSSRLLACFACGAPVEVPSDGGEVPCDQSDTNHTWGPAAEPRSTMLPTPDRSAGETDAQYEERRLAHLRGQANEAVGASPYATFDAPRAIGLGRELGVQR